jgi:hypothetical protein
MTPDETLIEIRWSMKEGFFDSAANLRRVLREGVESGALPEPSDPTWRDA